MSQGRLGTTGVTDSRAAGFDPRGSAFDGRRLRSAARGVGRFAHHKGAYRQGWWLAALAGAVLTVLVTDGCVAIRQQQAKRHVDRGVTLLAEQELETALLEFQAAAQLDPQLAVAHSRMGVIYRRMGEYHEAIDCFIEAIRRNPFSFDDAFNLAQLYHFTHRVKEAIQAYLHAAQLEPKDFDAQLNLGACFQEMGDFDQAVERFRKAIDVAPNRPHAYVNLGVALDAQKKYYEAVRAYKEALERDSGQPLVLVNLAHTYMNQDRLKMARHALEQAIRMDPQLAVAHEALGYCFFRTRDFDKAELSYKHALAYDWRMPRAHAGLGSINMLRYVKDHALTDRRDRALEHWHRSLELNPDQPRIRKLIARYKPLQGDPADVLLNERKTP